MRLTSKILNQYRPIGTSGTDSYAIMSAVAEILVEGILGMLCWLLRWLVFLPVVWLVSAPFILVIAVFRRERYGAAVFEMFASVYRFWKEWGILLTP
jgi:hypothetical protein